MKKTHKFLPKTFNIFLLKFAGNTIIRIVAFQVHHPYLPTYLPNLPTYYPCCNTFYRAMSFLHDWGAFKEATKFLKDKYF